MNAYRVRALRSLVGSGLSCSSSPSGSTRSSGRSPTMARSGSGPGRISDTTHNRAHYPPPFPSPALRAFITARFLYGGTGYRCVQTDRRISDTTHNLSSPLSSFRRHLFCLRGHVASAPRHLFVYNRVFFASSYFDFSPQDWLYIHF